MGAVDETEEGGESDDDAWYGALTPSLAGSVFEGEGGEVGGVGPELPPMEIRMDYKARAELSKIRTLAGATGTFIAGWTDEELQVSK